MGSIMRQVSKISNPAFNRNSNLNRDLNPNLNLNPNPNPFSRTRIQLCPDLLGKKSWIAHWYSPCSS